MAGATTYQVTVADISSLNGETLNAPYSFSFTTVTPQVVETQPLGENLPPDSVVTVRFNQPMEPTSTQAAFALVASSGQSTAGAFAWNELHTSFTFTPTTLLDINGQYKVHIAASAQSANGGATLAQDYIGNRFSIAGLPTVTSVMPDDGATGVDPEQSVVIRFNAPLSPTLVLENISAAPLLTSTQVYSYYSEYSNELTLSWFKEANTTYTVTLGSAIGDNYGNTLGQDYVTSFTTGDYAPFVRTSLPQFTHFSAFTQTQVSVLYRNIDSLNASLFRLPPDEFNKLTGENSYQLWENYELPDRAANRVWDRSYAPRAGRNVTAQEIISLTTPSGDLLPPGIYLLELEQPPAPPSDATQQDGQMTVQPLRNIIVLSNQNLVVKSSPYGESLAWLTDLQSGQSVANQPVAFYQNGRPVGQAVTDENGIAAAHLELDAQQSWLPVIAISGQPGAADFAIASNNWYEGIGPWDYNISSGYGADQYRMLFYTDRPIYRPGQTVNWKGIVRGLDVDKYTLPPTDLPINIVVRNDRGDEIFRQQVTPNAHGTVNGSLTLTPEATTGYYYLEATIEQGVNTIYNGVGFQVGAYRKPEFQITVKANQTEYVQGDAISVTVQADYFSGGPLANAPVTWRILAEPFYFNWTNAPAGRYFSFVPYDPENDNFDPYRNTLFGQLQEGVGTTNADGSFTFTTTADLANALQSQRWTFDVTVQSSTNQFVSGNVAAPVHKSQFYAGISPQSYVAQVDEESIIDLVTVTPQGEPFADADLQVVVQEVQWNSVYQRAADGSFYWQSTAERRPVYTETVTTGDDGMAQIRWTPSRGGQYQIVARGQDAAGNGVSSAAYLWVSARQDAFVPWRRDNNDRMELVADRELYAPGDVAHILIPSPFAGPVQALVTLERAGILESRVVTLQSNSETLDVPITAEHIPNVYVSVLLVKGVDETNPFPAMRLGYAKLTVDVAQKELTVDVTPSASTLRPGDPISYTLTVLDSDGAPVTDAEVSVALVDKALFTLAADNSTTLINAFYNEQPLGVTTGALLNINRDRLSQQLSEGAKGGGGGGGGPGFLELRGKISRSGLLARRSGHRRRGQGGVQPQSAGQFDHVVLRPAPQR
ncbi:MAG: Ig-like domain-containing protein [Caldilineaceae bacterium]